MCRDALPDALTVDLLALVLDGFLRVVFGFAFDVVLGFDLGLALGLDLGGIWSKGNKKLTRSSAASWAWCLGPAARVEVVSLR